jgi:hypothetical protein
VQLKSLSRPDGSYGELRRNGSEKKEPDENEGRTIF